MQVTITDYKEEYSSQLIELLTAFQGYLQYIDPEKVRVLAPGYGEKALEIITHDIKQKDGIFLVALDGEKVAGFIAGIIDPLTELEKLGTRLTKQGKVILLYLDTDYRGKGLGTQLVEKVKDYYIQRECEAMTVVIFRYNEGAQNLYQKLGFVERDQVLFKQLI